MQSKTQTIKAFFMSLLALVAFYLSFLVAYLVIGWILDFLSNFPIIGHVLTLFFKTKLNPPEWVLAIICPCFSRFIASFMLFLLSKDNMNTLGVSETMTGSYLIVLNVIAIVLNVIYNNFSGIFTNICVIIAGISFLNSGREDRHSN